MTEALGFWRVTKKCVRTSQVRRTQPRLAKMVKEAAASERLRGSISHSQ